VRFLLDANLSPRLVERLGVAGYQARHVADLELLAATDATIFDRATNDGDVVITADSDFSTLLDSRERVAHSPGGCGGSHGPPAPRAAHRGHAAAVGRRSPARRHGAARHSQMRTTTDTYSHAMPALAREAADQMGAALWPSTATRSCAKHDTGLHPEG